MVDRREIAIIGGGLIGVSSAVVLAREGHSVTIFEQDSIGHGCSFGNGAQYNAGSSLPMTHPAILWRAARWMFDSRGPIRVAPAELLRNASWFIRFINAGRMANWSAAYAALHDLNKPCAGLYREMLGDDEWVRLFRPTGALHVWRSGGPDDLTVRLRAAHGVNVSRVDAGELRDLEPALSGDYRFGLYFPDSGFVASPLALVERLCARAVSYGAAVQRSRVRAVVPGTDQVVLETEAGRHNCDVAVVAAGYASRRIARSLGLSLALVSERGYHIAIPDTDGGVTRPVTDAASAFVATPVAEGLRFVGIAEFDSDTAPPNGSQGDKLIACARDMLPSLQISEVQRWMGVRPSTPDSLPIVGPHPAHPNILFATGHGHMGISGAPMTAALISDLVARRPPRLPCAPYRPR